MVLHEAPHAYSEGAENTSATAAFNACNQRQHLQHKPQGTYRPASARPYSVPPGSDASSKPDVKCATPRPGTSSQLVQPPWRVPSLGLKEKERLLLQAILMSRHYGLGLLGNMKESHGKVTPRPIPPSKEFSKTRLRRIPAASRRPFSIGNMPPPPPITERTARQFQRIASHVRQLHSRHDTRGNHDYSYAESKQRHKALPTAADDDAAVDKKVSPSPQPISTGDDTESQPPLTHATKMTKQLSCRSYLTELVEGLDLDQGPPLSSYCTVNDTKSGDYFSDDDDDDNSKVDGGSSSNVLIDQIRAKGSKLSNTQKEGQELMQLFETLKRGGSCHSTAAKTADVCSLQRSAASHSDPKTADVYIRGLLQAWDEEVMKPCLRDREFHLRVSQPNVPSIMRDRAVVDDEEGVTMSSMYHQQQQRQHTCSSYRRFRCSDAADGRRQPYPTPPVDIASVLKERSAQILREEAVARRRREALAAQYRARQQLVRQQKEEKEAEMRDRAAQRKEQQNMQQRHRATAIAQARTNVNNSRLQNLAATKPSGDNTERRRAAAHSNNTSGTEQQSPPGKEKQNIAAVGEKSPPASAPALDSSVLSNYSRSMYNNSGNYNASSSRLSNSTPTKDETNHKDGINSCASADDNNTYTTPHSEAGAPHHSSRESYASVLRDEADTAEIGTFNVIQTGSTDGNSRHSGSYSSSFSSIGSSLAHSNDRGSKAQAGGNDNTDAPNIISTPDVWSPPDGAGSSKHDAHFADADNCEAHHQDDKNEDDSYADSYDHDEFDQEKEDEQVNIAANYGYKFSLSAGTGAGAAAGSSASERDDDETFVDPRLEQHKHRGQQSYKDEDEHDDGYGDDDFESGDISRDDHHSISKHYDDDGYSNEDCDADETETASAAPPAAGETKDADGDYGDDFQD